MLCREVEEEGTRGQVISMVGREFDNDSVYRINSSVDSTVKSSRFTSPKRHAGEVERYNLTVCTVVKYLDQWHDINTFSVQVVSNITA